MLRENARCRVVPFFATLPLFLDILGPEGIAIGRARSDYWNPGQTLPVSLFIIVFLTGLWFLAVLARGAIVFPRSPLVRSTITITSSFIALNVLCFLIGQIIVFDPKTVLFLIQVVFPISAMFVIIFDVRDFFALTRALQYAAFGILVGVLAVIAMNFLTFGPHLFGRYWTDNYKGIAIYQLMGYVPNVFATFAPILLGLFWICKSRVKRVTFLGGLFLVLLTIIHLPSAGALVIAGLGLVVFGVGGIYFKVFNDHLLKKTLSLLIPIALFVSLAYSPQESTFSALQDTSSSIFSGSVETRLKHIETDGSTLLLSPLWGKAYQADYGGNLPGLMGSRVGKPHNQFLDVGLKAGMPAVVLFLALISMPLIACICGMRITRSRRERIIGLSLFSALLPSVTFQNMILVPYVQSYSGIVLYMLGGLALSYYVIVKTQNRSFRHESSADLPPRTGHSA